MGVFWDLIQQSEKANDLEARVLILEKELSKTKNLLKKMLLLLENHLGKDIDGDGKLD